MHNSRDLSRYGNMIHGTTMRVNTKAACGRQSVPDRVPAPGRDPVESRPGRGSRPAAAAELTLPGNARTGATCLSWPP